MSNSNHSETADDFEIGNFIYTVEGGRIYREEREDREGYDSSSDEEGDPPSSHVSKIAKFYKKGSKSIYRLRSGTVYVSPETYNDLNEAGKRELARIVKLVRESPPKNIRNTTTGDIFDIAEDSYLVWLNAGYWAPDRENPNYNSDDDMDTVGAICNRCIEASIPSRKIEGKITTFKSSPIMWSGIHHLELNSNGSIHRVIHWAYTYSGSIYYFTKLSYGDMNPDENIINALNAQVLVKKFPLEIAFKCASFFHNIRTIADPVTV